MSADPTAQSGQSATAPPRAGAEGPTEQELREAYEAELSRITATDMIGQAAVSLLNIGARRLGPPDEGSAGARGEADESAGAAPGTGGAPGAGAAPGTGGAPGAGAAPGGSPRDLEQVRDAIDAARALLEILERRITPQELRPLRDALSRLQMAYAREVQLAPAQPAAGGGEQGQGTAPAAAGKPPAGEGQAGEGAGQKPGPGPAEASGRLWVPGR